jgi:hypothetical protein
MPTTTEAVALARRLRALRERQLGVRVTQQQLAEALSQEQPITSPVISTWENTTDPTTPPTSRLRAYARFFASNRSLETRPHLLSDSELDDDEREDRARLEKELLDLRLAAVGGTTLGSAAPVSLWTFSDSGPLTIICPDFPHAARPDISEPENPNFTDAFYYADLDSLIELYGHVRAENPTMQVNFRRASQIDPDDLSGHIVLVGGVAWNDVTRGILERLDLPVRQVMDDPNLTTGEPFEVLINNEAQRFYPRWSSTKPGELIEDVGVLARRVNPHHSRRTLTICNGIHSRGVLGAVRCLTDQRYREGNERYLADRFGAADDFGLLLRIDVVSGRAITPDLNQADRRLYEWSGSAAE